MSKRLIEYLVNRGQIIKDFGGVLPEANLAFHNICVNASGRVELSLGSIALPSTVPKSWNTCDAIKLTFGFNASSVVFYGDPSLGVDAEVKISIEGGDFLVSRMDSGERVMCAAGASAIHLIVRPFIN